MSKYLRAGDNDIFVRTACPRITHEQGANMPWQDATVLLAQVVASPQIVIVGFKEEEHLYIQKEIQESPEVYALYTIPSARLDGLY